MRYTHRVGLAALAAMLVLSAVASGSAYASPEWFSKSGGVNRRVSTPLKVNAATNLRVGDSNLLGIEEKVTCKGTMEATLEAAGIGKITRYEVSSCELTAGTCKTPTAVQPLNLPWKTELYNERGVQMGLESGGSGTPGFIFECSISGVKVQDTCNFNTHAIPFNEGGAVKAVFDDSGETSCTKGGANSGSLEGPITFEHPAGTEAISAQEVSAGEWRQGGKALSETIKTTLKKGKVEIAESLSKIKVECEDSGEGTASVGGAGTVTAWTASKCTKIEGAACGSTTAPTMEAIHLPWRSGLAFSEGDIQNLLSEEASKGRPGFKLTCTTLGIKVTYTCTAKSLSADMKNITAGVESVFDGEALECESVNGSGSGSVTGTQTVEAVAGGKLEASS